MAKQVRKSNTSCCMAAALWSLLVLLMTQLGTILCNCVTDFSVEFCQWSYYMRLGYTENTTINDVCKYVNCATKSSQHMGPIRMYSSSEPSFSFKSK